MNRSLLVYTLVLALGATSAFAALSARDLEPANVKSAVAALPVAQRRAYTAQVIQAIGAMPADAQTRSADIVSAARAAIGGASNGGATAVIAEVFISTPIDLLPGVAELLQPNFSQEVNGMDDARYDAFCTGLIKNASEAIEISGADAPSTRMAILVATFVKGAKDPARVQETYTRALPSSVSEVAPTLVAAALSGNVDQLAVSAGVDEVAETPADPDTVTTAAPGELPFDSPAPAGDSTVSASGEEKPVAVPLIARFTDDIRGMNADVHAALYFDWEAANVNDQDVLGRDAPIPTYPGLDVTTVPGFAEYAVPGGVDLGRYNTPAVSLPEASPGYGNQYIAPGMP